MASSPPFPHGPILLDSESSESIFNDLSLLHNIRAGDPPLTLHTNGGDRQASQRGDYHGLGTPGPSPSGRTRDHSPTSSHSVTCVRSHG